jgi:hypothetical protein
MKKIVRLMVALAALTISAQAWAQVDTNDAYRVIYGNLLTATATELTVEGVDASGVLSLEVFTINASTQIDGCSLDEVVAGTQLLVYVADRKAGSNVAAYVRFYGCEPAWQLSGTVVSIESGSMTLETRDDKVTGTATVRLKTTSETSFLTCYGNAREASDFSKGTAVVVNAAGAKNNLRALYVSAQDDCGESMHVEGTFVSYVDSVLSLNVEGKSDPLRLILSERVGRPYMDSVQFIYTCSGEIVSVSDVRSGERMSVVYLSISRQGDFLQYAQLLRNCPFSASGTITNVDGRSITIAANGQTYVAAVTDATAIYDCLSRQITSDALVVGLSVDAHITPEASGNTVLKIQIKNDCPYAFSIGGKISAVSQTAVTIDGLSSEERTDGSRELSFDAASLVLDCLNLPLGIDRLQVGSDVFAYYRTSGTERIADLVIVQSPCDVSIFAGTVLSATPSEITISEADGTSRSLAIDASSKLNDCNGESISISATLLGTTVTGSVLNTTTPPSIQWATFYVGCPVIVNEGGIIAEVRDSSLTLQGTSGRIELQRSSYTAAYDAYSMPTDWSTLRMGDSVCTWYDDGSKLIYRIITGSTCASTEEDGAKQMIGTVTSTSSEELTIENTAGEMSFALTNNTSMMSTGNAPVSASDISAGMRVSVMSSNYNRRGQPVASSVTVMMSPTFVNEESDPKAISFSPNPASDNITISNTLPGEMVTFYDQRGNRVLRTDAPTVNVSTLAPGVYSVVRPNGMTGRLVIVR